MILPNFCLGENGMNAKKSFCLREFITTVLIPQYLVRSFANHKNWNFKNEEETFSRFISVKKYI